MTTGRIEKRATALHRKTYSAHLDERTVEAVDALVREGHYLNRSVAFDAALRLLVLKHTSDADTEDRATVGCAA